MTAVSIDEESLAVGGAGACGGTGTTSTAVRPLLGLSPMEEHAWDDLADAAAEPNPFSHRWFVSAAASSLPQGSDAQVLQVWTNNGSPQLIGLFPFKIMPRYGRLPLRHIESWTHHHCFLGTPLLRARHERQAWSAILAALDAAPWAPGLLHVTGLAEGGAVHRGLEQAAAELDRSCDIVHRVARAMLQSDLSPAGYYEATVRGKKRKELRRLAARLAERGRVSFTRLGPDDHLAQWCDAFLALEAAGWKGRAGSALAATPGTEQFFRAAMAGARAAGQLEMIRLELDDHTIAMLINLFVAPGGFSFKIAYDEAFARFSPGVLVEIENLGVLDRSDIDWMDSCAVEDHPMIDGLWAQRRSIVRVSVPLAGWRRRSAFRLARTAETAAAFLKARARRWPRLPIAEPVNG